jgi:O-antigen/teichoic acid export membrane protein
MESSPNIIKGISWMSAFRVVTRIASYAKIATIARLLNPSQFGVFSIASLVLALLDILTETGINIYIVQSRRPLKEYINSAWVVSIVRGSIICLVLILSAPLVGQFFNTPSVQPVILFMSAVPLIRGFTNPAIVTIQKELRFNYEFWYRSWIFIFDAIVTIFLALITRSLYSLVFGMIATTTLEVILSFVLMELKPKLSLKGNNYRELFSSGKWVTLYSIFQYIAQQGDDVVVGQLLGSASLGIYQMSYKIAIIPISEVTDVVSKVTFPVFAKLRYSSKKKLFETFYKTVAGISIFSIMIGCLLFVFSKEIILVVLGNKWIEAVDVLRVLAIYGVLRAISGSASSLLLGIEKQKYVTIMVFVRCFALLITIYPFIFYFGLLGAAYSALISVIVEIPVIIYFLFLIRQIKDHPKIILRGNSLENG